MSRRSPAKIIWRRVVAGRENVEGTKRQLRGTNMHLGRGNADDVRIAELAVVSVLFQTLEPLEND
jgi:hypothetical protein